MVGAVCGVCAIGVAQSKHDADEGRDDNGRQSGQAKHTDHWVGCSPEMQRALNTGGTGPVGESNERSVTS